MYVIYIFTGHSTSGLSDCPVGYYCVNGTGYNPAACPAGTYSNTTGLAEVSQCTPCDPGYYCQGQCYTVYMTGKDNIDLYTGNYFI